MADKRFKIYRRVCRSCLGFFRTEHKHSKKCGECKLRIKHMRELRLLKENQKQEIKYYKETKII